MNKFAPLLTLFLAILLIVAVPDGLAQEKPGKVVCIAFYNLENLFDTIDSPDTDDKEFLPSAPGQWNSQKYYTKLQHLAEVINRIGAEESKNGPLFAGLSEVENRNVVEDLVKTPPLSSRGYSFIHYESPDARGIDVAFIYQPRFFKVLESKTIAFKIPDNPGFRSRDVLLVHGLMDKEHLYILITHWPSRSGGLKVTAPLRIAAADLCRATTDSIRKINPSARILIMGDLNDDPVDESLMGHLKTATSIENVSDSVLFNPMWLLFKDGEGTLAYKNAWNLFDQIIVSGTLVNTLKPGYRFFKAGVYKNDFIIQKDGQYAGYPLRTYGGKTYLGGYSDHFPVYMLLVRSKK